VPSTPGAASTGSSDEFVPLGGPSVQIGVPDSGLVEIRATLRAAGRP
jgi:hypothetical protein